MKNDSYEALGRADGPVFTPYMRILLSGVDVAYMRYMRNTRRPTSRLNLDVAIVLRKRCMDEKR